MARHNTVFVGKIGGDESAYTSGMSVALWQVDGVTVHVDLRPDVGEGIITVLPENIGQLIALLQQAERMMKGEES